ncbi:hypothetical protein KC319_g5270 [Hortaea werneckii]|nr:hypothetical protein KC352_g8086 [Hortaea werneckii]KAI7569913.1 hypothetical protein KC317_g2912 [Hortaea werneckii]KAI7623848.1 hypothetical protein KC346_g2508 [Hortaea werneckii]KAI7672611.1 hypothetical protein KC319_g5270 [Hortaea werneckii]KAI7715891.1 hypothetical protein KC322_g2811 [Hortaea werneckii]
MALDEPCSLTSTPPLPRYPGLLILLGLHIFIAESVDLIILETGIGGETDSTNVITAPIATGITEIGLDHVDRLGETLEKIAWHKSGIFKKGTPAFSVPQNDIVRSTLIERAEDKDTSVEFVQESFLTNNRISVWPDATYQRMNAALAVQLSNACFARFQSGGKVDADIARCIQDTELPAKFEIIDDGNITWVLTSSHNDQSVKATCEVFAQFIQR